MAEIRRVEYGKALTFHYQMFATDGIRTVQPTLAAGDVKVTSAAGTDTNVGTLPAGLGLRWIQQTLTAAEMTAATVLYSWRDQDGPAYADGAIIFETEGHHLAKHPGDVAHRGTAQAGGARTVTLPAAVSFDARGYLVELLSGPGAGEMQVIESFDTGTKVATVGQNWITQPTSATELAVYRYPRSGFTAATGVALAQSAAGIVSGATVAGTLSTTQATTNLTPPAAANHYKDRSIVFVGGALAGQAKRITASADVGGVLVLTFDALTAAPAAGVAFVIV